MHTIKAADAASGEDRRKGARGTSGIYALVDPRDGRVRYVGSSDHIEHRLYAHIHSGDYTPRARWVRELAQRRLTPNAVVLEAGDFGPPQSASRHEAEAYWIGLYHLLGEADLNVMLTPLGHRQSKDTPGKKLRAEVLALREQVKKLQSELAAERRKLLHHLHHDCTTVQFGAVQIAGLHHHAPHPFRGGAVVQASRAGVHESAEFAETRERANSADSRPHGERANFADSLQ